MLPPIRLLFCLLWRVRRALTRRGAALALRGENGDVPGWVMVTVMTAGLVAAVFAVFRDAIVVAVQNALDQVVSDTGR